jgi:hypothetical protein
MVDKTRESGTGGAGWASLLPALVLAVFAALWDPASAQSQQGPSQSGQAPAFAFRSRSYITPFPQTDRYHVHVIGDGLATGLASGLEEAFAQDGTLKIINSTKPSAGLARPDRADWAADIEELAKAQPIHIAVIMMGTNDVRNIRTDKGIARWGEEAWRTAYADEIDKLIKALKDKSVAVYWVGLPVMQNAKTNEAMAFINDIIRERTYIGGVKFVDTLNGFTDQLGAFTAYGPDLTGQSKRLREPDGVSFTGRGNRKLANYVEIILRNDLAAAKAERNIPLAGDDEEQSRLVPKAGEPEAAAANEAANPTPVPVSPGGPPVADQTPGPAPAENAAPQPRTAPAIPASANPARDAPAPGVISAFNSGYSPPGETIVGDIGAGVTGLATVSPVADLNANLGERRLPVTERLYYKTLVKGEALKPKPSRADDFKWPRG